MSSAPWWFSSKLLQDLSLPVCFCPEAEEVTRIKYNNYSALISWGKGTQAKRWLSNVPGTCPVWPVNGSGRGYQSKGEEYGPEFNH